MVSDDNEYSQVGENIRTAVNLLWEGFKTFFTINALLLAGIGFLYGSDGLNAGQNQSSIITTVGGVFFSLLGIVVAVSSFLALDRFISYIRINLNRGQVLESDPDRLMHALRGKFRVVAPNAAPVLTRIICGGFGVLWIAILIFAIYSTLQ